MTEMEYTFESNSKPSVKVQPNAAAAKEGTPLPLSKTADKTSTGITTEVSAQRL